TNYLPLLQLIQRRRVLVVTEFEYVGFSPPYTRNTLVLTLDHYKNAYLPILIILYQALFEFLLEKRFVHTSLQYLINRYFLEREIPYSFHYVYQVMFADLISLKLPYHLRLIGDLFQL